MSIDRNIASRTHQVEYYYPTDLVLGIYHKVRIPYQRIREFCYSFHNRLVAYANSKKDKKPREYLKKFIEKFVWDISLENGSHLKQRILKESFPAPNRETIISLALPKFCWVIKCFYDEGKIIEMYFDATDIPQNNNLLYISYYSDFISDFFAAFIEFNKQAVISNGGTELSLLVEKFLWPFYKYITKVDSYVSSFDNLFGALHFPRYLKENEFYFDEIKDQEAVTISKKKDADSFYFQTDIKYIWIINEYGQLVVGSESEFEKKNSGHPTLSHATPARIAGEIFFNNGKWKINTKSGRYSFDYTGEQQVEFLQNVINERFKLYFPQMEFIPDWSNV